MSYILDALKKSEQERRRGAVPDPLTVQDTAPRARRKRVLWPYIIVVALVLNAGIFLFRSDFPTAKKPAMPKASLEGKMSSVEEIPPLSTPAKADDEGAAQETVRGGAERGQTEVISRNKKNVAEERSAGVRTDAQRQATDRKPPIEAARAHPVPGAASVEEATAPAPAEAKTVEVPPPVANRLYNVSELPLQVRQGLPEFSVSVFLYSDEAASRLVRINGQMMREGQYLTPGVKLEEIVPGGLIFSCQRYRFLIAPR